MTTTGRTIACGRGAAAPGLLLTVVAALAIAVGIAAPGAGGAEPWQKLRRPLHLPVVLPGLPCPVTPGQLVTQNFGAAQGSGPVYAAGATPALPFILPVRRGQRWYPSSWGGQKTLWIARPSYQGLVLVRGRQLNGPNEVRFGEAREPATEMHLRTIGGNSAGGWWSGGTYTRLRAPGCYAWQVDAPTFSRVIVFQAVVTR